MIELSVINKNMSIKLILDMFDEKNQIHEKWTIQSTDANDRCNFVAHAVPVLFILNKKNWYM